MREAKIRSGMPVKLLSSWLERRYCDATCLCIACTHSLRAFGQSKTHLRSTSSG